MENLIIYPENQKQLQILKSLLEEMKIKFKSEEQVEELQDWQKEKILKKLTIINKRRFKLNN